jgi:hypothetical protein
MGIGSVTLLIRAKRAYNGRKSGTPFGYAGEYCSYEQ